MSTVKKEGNIRAHYKFFNDEEFEQLLQYKHVAPKTTWELWWLANITSHVEKALPNYWTANTITVLGNLALPIAGMITLYQAGPKYHADGKDDTPMPPWVFFMCAFAV